MAGSIAAWRAWGVADDGSLMSVYSRVRWPARTALEADRPISLSHGKGIFAWKDPDFLEKWVACAIILNRRGDFALAGRGIAWGRVSLWGRVVEHEDGWRATKAYPLDLKVWKADPARVAARYLVEAVEG